VCLILTSEISSAKGKFKSIEKLVNERSVVAKFNSLGGHSGKCINMTVTNNSNDYVYVLVEAGRQLESSNSNLQDILVVKESTFRVAPLSNMTAALTGYCCEANQGSPRRNSAYSVGRMSTPPLVKIAKYINSHPVPESITQRLVWSVSDNRKLEFFDSDKVPKGLQTELNNVVRNIQKEYPPQAQTITQTSITESSAIRTDHPIEESVNMEFMYRLPRNGMVSMKIISERGEEIRTLMQPNMRNAADYDLELKLSRNNLPHGKMYLIIYLDNAEYVRREIVN
jgi:hypothetical protein